MESIDREILLKAMIELIEKQNRSSWPEVCKVLKVDTKEGFISLYEGTPDQDIKSITRPFCIKLGIPPIWLNEFYTYLVSRNNRT